MKRILHLVTRFFGALVAREPNATEVVEVRSILSETEWGLWSAMSVADRSHSLVVLGRYDALRAEALTVERAGVLLHDIGKTQSDLGTFMRVIATLLGPRTHRFRTYHDHEHIGADMLVALGSDPLTVAVVRGDASSEVMSALRRADDV